MIYIWFQRHLCQFDHQRYGGKLLNKMFFVFFYSLRTGSHHLPVMSTDWNSHHGYKDLMSWRYIHLLCLDTWISVYVHMGYLMSQWMILCWQKVLVTLFISLSIFQNQLPSKKCIKYLINPCELLSCQIWGEICLSTSHYVRCDYS